MADLGGRPLTLTDDVHIALIGAIPYVIIPTQVAAYARVSHQNLSNWLIRGGKEYHNGEDTPYSRLFADFKHKQAEVVAALIGKIQACPKFYQAYAWILEKCFRQDFGGESEEMRELKALFDKILPLIGKGGKYNGRTKEVDTESDQAPRCITQEPESSEGQEDTRS